MKIAIRLLAVFAGYAFLVLVFESLLGAFQPANQSTLVITTTDADGARHERVLTRLDQDGALYVAANHWPRRWYRQALAKPDVQVDLGGGASPYRAESISPGERETLQRDHGLGIGFRILVGFAPRKFLRLDPVAVPEDT